jgi:hypothetical protein
MGTVTFRKVDVDRIKVVSFQPDIVTVHLDVPTAIGKRR